MLSLPEGKFLWEVTLEPEAQWALEEQSLPTDSCSVQVRTPPPGNSHFVSLNMMATE